MKVIIIGGVAAGMSAASKLRRDCKDVQITVYEKGNDVSYGACGLPYFISGENSNADLMRIRKADEFITKQNIDVRLFHEVTGVDMDKREVTVKDLLTGEIFTDKFDKMVIATGASPNMPKVKGNNLKNIFTLKSIDDGEYIRNEISKEEIKNVIIVGSGFIGLEMAEACLRLGKVVRIIEMMPGILSTYEPEITEVIAKELVDNGVSINTSEKVEEFLGDNVVHSIRTDKGIYDADMVIVSAGVTPNTGFVRNSGLVFLENGAIKVNTKMETGIDGVYAGGDCACVYHKILKKEVYLPLGTNANKQGKIIGENLADANKNKEFPGALGTSVLRVKNIEAGRTGISEADAIANSIPYATAIIEADNHAPYYPNPKPIRIKMIYDTEMRKVLGVCMAGGSGTALRVNTFAAIIDAGMTVEQVSNLDLCYAPPFSQVWDPIHVVANSAK